LDKCEEGESKTRSHDLLTEHVRAIGNNLAAVADRKLPYEFVVLNDSVRNAWAMPGGKIATDRGLLYELKNEAELAAVLGHEIVHAAARHGAKSMERESLLQGAILTVGIDTGDSHYSQLYVQGAQIAAQLAATEYGRDAELESDLYVKHDLPQNSDRYLQTGVQAQLDGTLVGLLRNAAPVSLIGISMRLIRVEGDRTVDQTNAMSLPNTLQPGQLAFLAMAKTQQLKTSEKLKAFRVVVESAQVAP
jgi:hypothetical protein